MHFVVLGKVSFYRRNCLNLCVSRPQSTSDNPANLLRIANKRQLRQNARESFCIHVSTAFAVICCLTVVSGRPMRCSFHYTV